MCVRVSKRERGRSAGRLLGWAAPVPREGPRAHTGGWGEGREGNEIRGARPRPRSRGERLTAPQLVAAPGWGSPGLPEPPPGQFAYSAPQSATLFIGLRRGGEEVRGAGNGTAQLARLRSSPPPGRGAAGAGVALPAAAGKVWQGKLGRGGRKLGWRRGAPAGAAAPVPPTEAERWRLQEDPGAAGAFPGGIRRQLSGLRERRRGGCRCPRPVGVTPLPRPPRGLGGRGLPLPALPPPAGEARGVPLRPRGAAGGNPPVFPPQPALGQAPRLRSSAEAAPPGAGYALPGAETGIPPVLGAGRPSAGAGLSVSASTWLLNKQREHMSHLRDRWFKQRTI